MRVERCDDSKYFAFQAKGDEGFLGKGDTQWKAIMRCLWELQGGKIIKGVNATWDREGEWPSQNE